ncbi:hypothetical protein, conserved [Eimeria necatrix]|uniref:Uncharacterized protein n=1 Tax=Eimeria necatrix TaxID=51315 RepID=U6MYX3_9EIME|nr:hypothetical protein, conserved [Eimeria necatrix]CDJ68243.1 hypothetical protein, conserved [Eimeria necatrix]
MTRAGDGTNVLGAMARAKREDEADGFWLDNQAFIVFGRQVDTPPVRAGTAMLLLDPRQSRAVERDSRSLNGREQQWLKRYCEIRGNLLLYTSHAEAAFEGAYMLEDFSFKTFPPKRAVAMGVIPTLPATDSEGDSPMEGVVIVGTSRHDGVYGKFVKPLVMLVDTPRAAAGWKEKLDCCSAAAMQLQIRELQALLQRERAAAIREREATALISKQHELALMETEGSKRTLLLEIERLQQRNQRLQASGEVTEKAAAEYVDQKHHEVSFLQNELATQLAGSKRLEEEIVRLREVLSSSQQKAQSLAAENSQLNCKVADFLKDLEDARDNPSRFALLMSRLRAANQKTTIENKRLREENASLTQNFHQLEEKFKEKVVLIRQIAERGDIFDLLRKWLTCSERKIRFYEQGYKWTAQQEEDELNKIEELQRAIRVAEAAARSSYISHRAFLLGEQLKACTTNSSYGDIYFFLKVTLERFGWLFGDVEPYQPTDEDNREVPFWRDAGDRFAPIPLREQIYPFGGLEGGPQLSLVPDVCVLRSVEKLVPAGEYMKLKNTHALLELDFSELKETVDKLVECRTRMRDLKTQCALNQASSEWKFFTAHQAALVDETAVEEEGDAKINGRPIA